MKKNTFNIEKWQIDPLHNSIQQGNTHYEIEPKAMQVLVYLAQHAGKTIDKLELQKAIWPNQDVTDAALTRIISQLRRCLADHPKSPSYIMTIKNTGYRLIAEVTPKKYFVQNADENESNGHFHDSKAYVVFGVKFVVTATVLALFMLIYKYTSAPAPQKIETRYITTDKGEEMSPALSPNGQVVVYRKVIYSKKNPYDIAGALFMKDINTNKVTRLTHTKGSSSHPVWSPDNRHVAFAHETELSNKKTKYEIYSVDTQTNQVQLLTEVGSHTHGITWSPDGQYLVYPDGTDQNEVNSLIRFDIATKEKTYIIAPINSHEAYSYPSYSPDGKYLAVIRTDQGAYDNIDLIENESFSSRNILSDQQKISAITWKSNDTLIISSGGVASSQLLEFSIKSPDKPKIINVADNHIEYLSYSQATKRLTFESIQQPYNIWQSTFSDKSIFPLDYTPFTRSSRQELEAMESPDGSYTAIISSRSGSFEIWLKDGFNGQSQKLTDIHANRISGLDWSPQSDRLAFVATINNEKAIYWVMINSKQLHRFSHGMNNYSLIGWENKDSSLLFSSNPYGKWKLWRLYTNNNDIELVSDEPIMHGRLSPNRKMIYFVKYKHPGIWGSNLINIEPALVPGTESISVYRSWTVSEKGIYYVMFGDIGKSEELYFQSFDSKKPLFISWIRGLYLNRIYWSNKRLLYCIYDSRNSDIGMIENF